MRALYTLALMLALGGCAGEAAKLAAAGSSLVDAGIAYESKIITERQRARYECIRIRELMARQFEKDDKLEEAMGAWAALHKDLAIIKAIQGKDTITILAGLNEAWPCVLPVPK